MKSPETAVHLRVIGIGSPAPGDDLGWRALEAIRSAGLEDSVDLVLLDRPGIRVLDHLQPGLPVILIDAMEAGLTPGSVQRVALDEFLPDVLPPSSHQLGLAESLALARALGDLPGTTQVIGIQRGHPDRPGGPWLDAALENIVAAVRETIGTGTSRRG